MNTLLVAVPARQGQSAEVQVYRLR
jgi:hypothetical protein